MEEELYKSLKDLYEMFDDPEPGSRTWALLRRAKSVLAEYEAAQQDAQADDKRPNYDKMNERKGE